MPEITGCVAVRLIDGLGRYEKEPKMIAALYVETDGAYFGLDGVDPWDEAKDARRYTGPLPVVAHPPCQLWGAMAVVNYARWGGEHNKPGNDGGCFAAALTAVRNHGGVIEHPAHSHAWKWHGIATPPNTGGWVKADEFGGWTCHVEQGHYGHMSRKPTWLLAHTRGRPPELNWTKGDQRLPDWMIERYGYEKARRIGVVAMVGGKNKTAIRHATPDPFRDVLISIARSARRAAGNDQRGECAG